jgi:DNA-binding transcriptional MerR regulator
MMATILPRPVLAAMHALGDTELQLEAFSEHVNRWLEHQTADAPDGGIGRLNDGVSARLVRDYVSRGLVSAPDRRGKEAYYGAGHLGQLLMTRELTTQGYPLRKAAELLRLTYNGEIERVVGRRMPLAGSGRDALRLSVRPLMPGPATYNPEDPREVASMLRRRVSMSPPDADPSPMAYAHAPLEGFDLPTIDRVVEIDALRTEGRRLVIELGGSTPTQERVRRIEITPDLVVMIGEARLETLGLDEARQIGTAVAGALLDAKLETTPTRSRGSGPPPHPPDG